MSLWLEPAAFPVVLDSCVLYPYTLRDLLLEAANFPLYRAYWSPKILEDTLRHLVQDERITIDHANHLRSKIETTFPEALVKPPAGIVEAVNCDPGDRHVVATAIAAKAELIVTNNIRQFPANVLDPLGIEAMTPDQFLCDLWGLQPQILFGCLQTIADRQKDPSNRTMNFVLGSLNRQAKDFVHCVQEDILD